MPPVTSFCHRISMFASNRFYQCFL